MELISIAAAASSSSSCTVPSAGHMRRCGARACPGSQGSGLAGNAVAARRRRFERGAMEICAAKHLVIAPIAGESAAARGWCWCWCSEFCLEFCGRAPRPVSVPACGCGLRVLLLGLEEMIEPGCQPPKPPKPGPMPAACAPAVNWCGPAAGDAVGDNDRFDRMVGDIMTDVCTSHF